MATGKKSTKTSKTAHVLNVITGAAAGTEGADPNVTAPAHPPVAPILEVARANDDALSNTILEALIAEADELHCAESVEPPDVQPQVQAPEFEAEPQDVSVQEDVLQADLSQTFLETTFGEDADEQPEFDPQAPSHVDHPPKPGDKYYNVIQALVEEKTPKYMRMMGMCLCTRCQADVKALALSNLTPKYIVMQPSEITPMFSVYEGKFGAAATAQIISACRVVRDNPRH